MKPAPLPRGLRAGMTFSVNTAPAEYRIRAEKAMTVWMRDLLMYDVLALGERGRTFAPTQRSVFHQLLNRAQQLRRSRWMFVVTSALDMEVLHVVTEAPIWCRWFARVEPGKQSCMALARSLARITAVKQVQLVASRMGQHLIAEEVSISREALAKTRAELETRIQFRTDNYTKFNLMRGNDV